ncbi:GNAT family N-acetyltransferase [Lacticaseibacillus saniviri]
MIIKTEQLTANQLTQVRDIWLAGNLSGHPFIDPAYWYAQVPAVEIAFRQATFYLDQADGEIRGFLGMVQTQIAGLFIRTQDQGQGIGTALLKQAQHDNTTLTLEVYRENTRALKLYQHLGFVITRTIDDGHAIAYEMMWQEA